MRAETLETSLAHAFHLPHPEDDLYPLLEVDAPEEFFMGVYPTSIADLDFADTVQALPAAHEPQQTLVLKSEADGLLHQPLNLPRAQGAALSPPPPIKSEFGTRRLSRSRSRSESPPSSIAGSDGTLRDSEEILNAPVKSLTEEEKKLRRRAQVAKSARKHRNRQKEELARLREQVQMLQEQMAIMTHHQGSSSPTTIKREQEVITQHRKRKKVDELEEGEVETGGVLSNPSLGYVTVPPPPPPQPLHIQHWYHRLPVDTLERSKMLCRIADKRMAIGGQYIRCEFGPNVSYPMTDIKLNSNGPDLEIKQVRGRVVPGYTHHELGEACWNSFSNFQFDVPERFKRHVTCERLMELDTNTRYGRTIVPVLRDHKGRMVYFHSYFLVRRHVRDDYVMITWETITDDNLYPSPEDENPETTLRNDEVGCMIMESERLADKGVRTIFRSITHSTPPVGVMTHPRGKVNEAFLTVFCRNADTVENSAWNLLRKTYPDRVSTAQVIL